VSQDLIQDRALGVDFQIDMTQAAARVLIAEDSDTERAMCGDLLREEGLDVHEAPDGRIGLDLCRIIHPDLLILDLDMPRLHGLDLLRKLRDDPKVGETPVIVLTADGRPATATAAFDAGATDCFAKPAPPDEFLARVREALAPARD
jgi:DNA-binding response OmpR family regulator